MKMELGDDLGDRANLNAKKEGILVSTQEVKSVAMEKLQNHAMDMIT